MVGCFEKVAARSCARWEGGNLKRKRNLTRSEAFGTVRNEKEGKEGRVQIEDLEKK